LTEPGTGIVRYTPAASAPTTASYVTTAADATLSGEKVLRHLANWNNDIPTTIGFLAAALQWEDDFDDGAASADWVEIGTPDFASQTDIHGFLYVEHSGAAEAGVYRVVTPATAMTFLAKLHFSLPILNTYVGLVVTDSANTPIATATVQRTATGVQARTGASGGTVVALPGFYFCDTIYLMLLKNGTSYTLRASKHGYQFWEPVASWTQAGTLARLQVLVLSDGSESTVAHADFVRVYDQQASAIGGVP
jgi:hypothetical protein